MSQYNLGRIIPIFKGSYNSTTTYNKLDIVYYGGSSYVAKGDTTGNLPTNTTYWQIVALKGELSPTLTTAQMESIISQITAQSGWISDSTYQHTDNNFTDDYKNAVDGIGDGTLTIQTNSITIGTFNGNQGTDTTVNITIPTDVSQLQGTDEFYKTPTFNQLDNSIVEINKLEKNSIYYYDDDNILSQLKINNVDWSDYKDSFLSQPIIVEFRCGEDFSLTIPTDINHIESVPTFAQNQRYRLSFYGYTMKTEKII